jgi:hypothetical protein
MKREVIFSCCGTLVVVAFASFPPMNGAAVQLSDLLFSLETLFLVYSIQ